MILLFEGYAYPLQALAPLLPVGLYQLCGSDQCQTPYVGYCHYNGQALMLLPKVFLNENGQAFGHHHPESLLHFHSPQARQTFGQEHTANGQTQADFMFSFSVWLYRAIRQFRERHQDSALLQASELLSVSGSGDDSLSELEIVYSLLRFNQENQTLFTFIKRFNTSQNRKTSWASTVRRTHPLLQGGKPIYTELVNKEKHINYDEELLVIYFATLRHLSQQYGFHVELNPLYALPGKHEFEQFKVSALQRLKQIRGNYFSDKMLQIWQLLYLYFARQEAMKPSQNFTEILLVRDFNIVFEDMMDSLLSDPKENFLEGRLRDQPDGKRVDHIFGYADLLQPDNDRIFHIGDSKYYKAGAKIGLESVFKQFTYAKNVIQLNIDWLEGGKSVIFRYRDPFDGRLQPYA